MWSYKHILREASALFARSTEMGIPEPLKVGRATSTALTLFCIMLNSRRREPGGIIFIWHLLEVVLTVKQKEIWYS